jgi:hypothetical protein
MSEESKTKQPEIPVTNLSRPRKRKGALGPLKTATAQLGTTLKIGFSTNVYTGYIMEDFESEPTGDVEVIKGEDNETTTILTSDLGDRIKFSAIIKGTGSLTPPDKSSIVSINSVKYRTEQSSVKQTRGASILNFQGIKEDSMTYT